MANKGCTCVCPFSSKDLWRIFEAISGYVQNRRQFITHSNTLEIKIESDNMWKGHGRHARHRKILFIWKLFFLLPLYPPPIKLGGNLVYINTFCRSMYALLNRNPHFHFAVSEMSSPKGIVRTSFMHRNESVFCWHSSSSRHATANCIAYTTTYPIWNHLMLGSVIYKFSRNGTHIEMMMGRQETTCIVDDPSLTTCTDTNQNVVSPASWLHVFQHLQHNIAS